MLLIKYVSQVKQWEKVQSQIKIDGGTINARLL